MAKIEKLLARLKSRPTDFTWAELTSVMSHFGFDMFKGTGSSRKFIHRETKGVLFIHEPHPVKVLKTYQLQDAIKTLKSEGYLK